MITLQTKLLVVLAAVCVLLLAVAMTSGGYPCGVAEVAPDVPAHVKEQCREQRRMGR